MDPPAPFHPGATRRVRQTVRVGVGVAIINSAAGKIYAGRRKGSHGSTKLALPGGHLEVNESWVDCARREVREEMGIEITNVKFLHVTNDIMRSENKHYVTIFMQAETANPEASPQNCEPDKCEGWEMYTLTELVGMLGEQQLFSPLENMLLECPTALSEFTEAFERTSI